MFPKTTCFKVKHLFISFACRLLGSILDLLFEVGLFLWVGFFNNLEIHIEGEKKIPDSKLLLRAASVSLLDLVVGISECMNSAEIRVKVTEMTTTRY